jgi:hypothetical protein
MRHRYLLAITLLCATSLRAADTLTIHADRPTTQVSPALYGRRKLQTQLSRQLRHRFPALNSALVFA